MTISRSLPGGSVVEPRGLDAQDLGLGPDRRDDPGLGDADEGGVDELVVPLQLRAEPRARVLQAEPVVNVAIHGSSEAVDPLDGRCLPQALSAGVGLVARGSEPHVPQRATHEALAEAHGVGRHRWPRSIERIQRDLDVGERVQEVACTRLILLPQRTREHRARPAAHRTGQLRGQRVARGLRWRPSRARRGARHERCRARCPRGRRRMTRQGRRDGGLCHAVVRWHDSATLQPAGPSRQPRFRHTATDVGRSIARASGRGRCARGTRPEPSTNRKRPEMSHLDDVRSRGTCLGSGPRNPHERRALRQPAPTSGRADRSDVGERSRWRCSQARRRRRVRDDRITRPIQRRGIHRQLNKGREHPRPRGRRLRGQRRPHP